MAVTHVLMGGTVLPDIAGYIVRKEDAPSVYDLMERINQNARKRGRNEKKSKKQDA